MNPRVATPDDIRIVQGFMCRDGNAKDTMVNIVELENAVRLSFGPDDHLVMTTAQAELLSNMLGGVSHRIKARHAK